MRDPYAESGVHLAAAEEAVARYRRAASLAARPEVLAGVGGFAAAFRLGSYRRPVLVSAADGVGTKLLLARQAGRLEPLGQDLAAMVLNDLACLGARPLFFLDYLGVGRLDPEEAGVLVEALARALAQECCALVGGETAELPGLYQAGDFDFVGFAVGVVEEEELVTPRGAPGDVLVGLAASGFHANGFSLVRRILDRHPELATPRCLEELLTPTRLYGKAARALAAGLGARLHGLCHVTGGGLPGNVPRCLLPGCGAELSVAGREPARMAELRQAEGLSRAQVAPVWNLGVGFVAAVAPGAAAEAISLLQEQGEDAFVLGRVTDRPGVELS